VAFFSGNTVYWQVRYEDEGRTMVCYKYTAREQDPLAGSDRQHLLTSIWSDPLIGRPENLTTGLSFCHGGYIRFGKGCRAARARIQSTDPSIGSLPIRGCAMATRWGWARYIATYEVDGCAFNLINGLPVPTHEDSTPAGFTILATSPARLLSNTPDNRELILAAGL